MKKKFIIPKNEADDIDVMLPIMSLMLILIPVLVGNMAFYHFHSIQVNTPAVSSDAPAPEDTKKSEQKVMGRLRITDAIFRLELLDEDSGAVLIRKEMKRDRTGIVHLRKEITEMRESYKKLDVVLLSSYRDLRYEELLNILDEGIKSIIDEKTKKSLIKVVIVPLEA